MEQSKFKFKVYWEAEINGEVQKGIELEASWFLLTQMGELMVYGPIQPPSKPKEYKKLIPLFYMGTKDCNNEEIYSGDILKLSLDLPLCGTESSERYGIVEYDDRLVAWSMVFPMYGEGYTFAELDSIGLFEVEKVGNIYTDPDFDFYL